MEEGIVEAVAELGAADVSIGIPVDHGSQVAGFIVGGAEKGHLIALRKKSVNSGTVEAVLASEYL